MHSSLVCLWYLKCCFQPGTIAFMWKSLCKFKYCISDSSVQRKYFVMLGSISSHLPVVKVLNILKKISAFYFSQWNKDFQEKKLVICRDNADHVWKCDVARTNEWLLFLDERNIVCDTSTVHWVNSKVWILGTRQDVNDTF